MTRVTLHHLIGRLKTGISDLSHTELLMVSLLSRDDRCVCSQWEVNAWIRHQVGLERQNIMSHIDPPLFTKLQIQIGKGRSLVSKDELCATYNVLTVPLANGSENYFLKYPWESKLASHHLVFVKAFKGTRQPVRNSSLVKIFLGFKTIQFLLWMWKLYISWTSMCTQIEPEYTWNSVKSTFRAPSKRRDAVMEDTICPIRRFRLV